MAGQTSHGVIEPPLTSHLPPAVFAVLDTNELFEQILLGLDFKTLLLAQRVSRQWSSVISSSKLLQRKLFLLPATGEVLPKLNLVEQCHDLENEDDGPSHFSYRKIHNASYITSGSEQELVIHNPLLVQRRSKCSELRLWASRSGLPDDEEISIISSVVSKRQVFRRRQQVKAQIKPEIKPEIKPSWEKMLLFQPPPQKLDLLVDAIERDPRYDFKKQSKMSYDSFRKVQKRFHDLKLKSIISRRSLGDIITTVEKAHRGIVAYGRGNKQPHLEMWMPGRLLTPEQLRELNLEVTKMHKSRHLQFAGGDQGVWYLPRLHE